jgi:L-threonylcarbamoyladenylate synthase
MIQILLPSEENIKKAAVAIKKGGIVAFPTETVYGLGASIYQKDAILKIFELKQRPHFDPLIVHISSFNDLDEIVLRVPKKVYRLVEKFWPGPLTVVLKKRKNISDIITSGLDTVAVRMPKNEIALKLIKYSTPIAAPSANKFTRISPTRVSHILKQFESGIDYIIDGGKTKFGLESTIIKYEDGKFYLLRKGALPVEEIEEVISEKLYKPNKKVLSPGIFRKHYSPIPDVIIVDNPKDIDDDPNSAYIAFSKRPFGKKFKVVKVLSKTGNMYEAASNLFDYFHQLEDIGVSKIYIEKVEEKGLGLAIMDRIRKASGKEV